MSVPTPSCGRRGDGPPRRSRTVTLGALLDRDHIHALQSIRRRIGLRRLGQPGGAHVSLLVLHALDDHEAFDRRLAAVAATTAPFSVSARGLGVFHDHDGSLVLYVPVVRHAALAALQQQLYEAAVASGGIVDGYYRPASWFPHVTVWQHPTARDLGEAVEALAGSRPIAWSLRIGTLAQLDATGVLAAVPLTGAGAL